MDGDVSSDPMEGVENKEQSAPVNVDADEQPTPQNDIPRHEKLPSLIMPYAKYNSNKMREAIATWVLGTEQPFSVVEDDLFVHMMKTTTPLFEKTSRTSTKADCFKIYEHEKKTLTALTKAASKISLTTDCWKSSHQKIEYMVITGHFIDHNWRLQKRVLSFVHVPPPRTGLDIDDDLRKYKPHFHHLPNDDEWAHGRVFSVRSKIQNEVSRFSFPTIYSNAEKSIEEVKKALYEMYEEYLEIHDASVREAAMPANGCGGNEVSKTTSLGSGWEAFGEFIKNTDLERQKKSELDMYLAEGGYRQPGPQKDMDSFKALEWWNVHN
ncbi:unnamed protein product [Lactuca virosa]|uniref:HAT C-terminal dimerisation domain-containing protein n=1 Tax=Lactuca virosa TaxID=75947 RepID=A0AAU9M602_9ASTR|nr:unnamed protein product [Lactuca virosa]